MYTSAHVCVLCSAFCSDTLPASQGCWETAVLTLDAYFRARAIKPLLSPALSFLLHFSHQIASISQNSSSERRHVI